MPLRSLPCVISTVATQDLRVFWFQGLALIKVTVSNRQCRLTSQLRQLENLPTNKENSVARPVNWITLGLRTHLLSTTPKQLKPSDARGQKGLQRPH